MRYFHIEDMPHQTGLGLDNSTKLCQSIVIQSDIAHMCSIAICFKEASEKPV